MIQIQAFNNNNNKKKEIERPSILQFLFSAKFVYV
jgi:hypothetical protein